MLLYKPKAKFIASGPKSSSIIELNYNIVGHAEHQIPILILHGLFGSLKNWGSISRKLADHHAVISVDLRNHGQSPHADSMAYADMATDVIQLMDQLNIESAILVGHSMGGKVAMTCALKYPERIKSLVVADIAPVDYQHEFDQIIAGLKTLPLRQMSNRSEADQLLSQSIDQPMLRQFLLQNLVKDSDQFHWRINLAAIEDQMPVLTRFPLFSNVQGFNKPSLFLRGEHSPYVLAEHHEKIYHYFPTAKIETLPDAGHWLHAEQPDLFYKSVLEYLDENAN